MDPVCPEPVAPNSTCTAGKNGLPPDTPDFVSQNPPLWPEHRRLEVTSIILNGMLLLGCALMLFRATEKRHWKSKKGGLPKTDAARAKSWLWVLERLFVVDLSMTIFKSFVAIWISRHSHSTPSQASRLYLKLRDIDCFFLFLTHTGIIFLLAEMETVLWGPVEERPVGKNFWYFLNRICHVSGWLMAFGVTTIQLSVSLLKMYRHFGLPGSENVQRLGSGQDMVAEGMIKILLFFIGYVVFAPYYVLSGPWVWANLIVTTATWTWRLARDAEKKRSEEAVAYVLTLIVDFFYSRLPTLCVLVMLSMVLAQRK